MKKILIVEDERIMHFIYRQLLKNDIDLQTVEVISAYGYDEAVAMLSHDDDKEDTCLCVILDLDLGDGHTGWELLDSPYLGGYKRLLVFICSSSSSLKDQERALEYTEVVGYFQKPIQQHVIRSIANKLITS